MQIGQLRFAQVQIPLYPQAWLVFEVSSPVKLDHFFPFDGEKLSHRICMRGGSICAACFAACNVL